MNFPKIPLAQWVDHLVDWITSTFDPLFSAVTSFIEGLLDNLVKVLDIGPPILLILIITLFALYTCRWGVAIFSLIGLLLIDNLGYWDATVQTIALVLSSVVLTIIIGIPLGIWASQNDTAKKSLLLFWTLCRRCLHLFT